MTPVVHANKIHAAYSLDYQQRPYWRVGVSRTWNDPGLETAKQDSAANQAGIVVYQAHAHSGDALEKMHC